MKSLLRRRLTYANIVATLALFIALGGSSYAAIVVTGKNVKDASLTSRDVKDTSLLARDFKAGQLPAGPSGAQGPAGETGAQGPRGDQGPAGPASDRLIDEWTSVGPSGYVFSSTGASTAGAARSFTLTRPARIRVERDVALSRTCAPPTSGTSTPKVDVTSRLTEGTGGSGAVVPHSATLAHIPSATLSTVRITLLSTGALQPGTYTVQPLASCRIGTFERQEGWSGAQQVYTVE